MRSELRPIFVGGCERSGTTFLGSLLGAAPGAVTVPESQFRERGERTIYGGRSASEALRRMVGHPRFGTWSAAGAQIDEGFEPRDLRDAIEHLVRRYAACQGSESPRVWVDHTPSNVRSGVRSAALFPEARFVHIVRDGRGVAASLIRGTWGPNTILSAAEFWTERIALGVALETSFLRDRTIRVRYEDILDRPEPTLRRVCEACDLEFVPEMLQGGRFAVPQTTRYQHQLVGSPPDSSRAKAWEGDLTPREVEIFEAKAGELLTLLGYDARHPLGASRSKDREKLRMVAIECLRKRLVNPFRESRRP